MKAPADMTEAEHQHWERRYEEAAAIRDAKGLRGLEKLAALREHPGTSGFRRPGGQVGQR